MRNLDLICHRPSPSTTEPATQLMLLFHGVGAMPDSMAPLGDFLAQHFPSAWIVAVAAAHPGDGGLGRQWFSTAGITDANRWGRVAEAMPAFRAAITHWQRESGVSRAGTALMGFSQGAIMALECTQTQPALAGRVVAMGGRFAVLPNQVPAHTTTHFIHGKADAVIPYAHTVKAAEHWISMGADVTADVIPHLGHSVNDAVAQLVVQRLTTHIPARLWQEALRSVPRAQP
jgi:phospholipase/carboxylesterase